MLWQSALRLSFCPQKQLISLFSPSTSPLPHNEKSALRQPSSSLSLVFLTLVRCCVYAFVFLSHLQQDWIFDAAASACIECRANKRDPKVVRRRSWDCCCCCIFNVRAPTNRVLYIQDEFNPYTTLCEIIWEREEMLLPSSLWFIQSELRRLRFPAKCKKRSRLRLCASAIFSTLPSFFKTRSESSLGQLINPKWTDTGYLNGVQFYFYLY